MNLAKATGLLLLPLAVSAGVALARRDAPEEPPPASPQSRQQAPARVRPTTPPAPALAPQPAPGRAEVTAAAAPGSENEEPEEGVSRDAVYRALERRIPEKLPHLDLTQDDVFRLSTEIIKMREASGALRKLPEGARSAGERRRLRGQLERSLAAFREITGMSAVEVTEALSDEGVTHEENDHDEIVHEPLPEPAD